MGRSKLFYWKLSILFLCSFISWTSQQPCNHTLFGLEDTLYTLSDELVDADSAVSKCSALGGYLTMIADETIKSSFVNASIKKYTKDLVRVWIFYNRYKTKYTAYFNTPTESGSWRSTKRLGQLYYVDLYSSSKAGERIDVWFCKKPLNKPVKWRVAPEQIQTCNKGWKNDFKLYGIQNESAGYKEVFIYQDRAPVKTRSNSFRLLSNDAPYDAYVTKRDSFFVPDINIFTGVRFNVSTLSWQWSNGSHALFNSTGINTCQQQTMHYGEGWEVTNKSCKNQPAYYSCQAKFMINAISHPCQSTQVIVSWNDDLSEIGGNGMQVEVVLTGNGLHITRKLHYSSLSYTFVDLQSRTIYVVKATLFATCNSTRVQAKASITTSYGVPDNITSARISSIENCIVTVPDLKGPVTEVRFYAKSGRSTTVHTFTFNNKTLFTIPLSQHGSQNVTLEVQAETCDGSNALKPVTGYCQAKDSNENGQTEETAKFPIGATAGASGGLLLLVLLLVVVLFVKRKKRKSKSKTSVTVRNATVNMQLDERTQVNSIENGESTPPPAGNNYIECRSATAQDIVYENRIALHGTIIKRIDLCENYALKIAKDFQQFREEFKDLNDKQQSMTKTHDVAHLQINKGKNRYKDIYPYDESRVVLLHQTNDYINASYVAGYSQDNKFIATQGPKETTISDFWLMIWQQTSSIIVMLTRLRESDENKCEKYWADLGQKVSYGSFIVQTTEENELGGIVQRKFKLHNENGEQRHVTQFQFTSWPDHGIPATTSNMIYLRKMVEEIHDKQHPVIVHCSAGAGRTGTYIAMDILFDQLEIEGQIDVSSCVANMRQSRKDIVQNVNQYIFIHKLVLEHDSMPDTDRTTDVLQYISATELSDIATKEFHQLSQWEFSAQTSIKSIRPGRQKSMEISENTSTIELQNLGCSKTFVVTRYPGQGREQDLWKLAIKSGASTVLTLENDMGNYTTWHIGKTIQLGDVTIQVENLQDCDDFVVHFLTAMSTKHQFEPSVITHLHLKVWIEDIAPPSEITMINMIDALLTMKQNERNGKILCSCRTASRRSGTVIALMNILERLKTLNKVDVFRSVKDLRDLIPNMVDNLVLYKYIYNVVLAYLASFDTYANYR